MFSDGFVGLCEEVGFQPISELSMTDGARTQACWKQVPDSWSCNVETPLAEQR